MIKSKAKLFFIIKIFIIYFCLSLKTYSDDSNEKKYIIALGSNDAIVKIKVFSSLTCPHCAKFHNEVLPAIKEKYVESGKVQIIFIDFPLDIAAFNASKLLHCVDHKQQINLLDTIYEIFYEWTNGENINEINIRLKKIVKNLGISPSNFDKCLIDEVISDKILEGRINAHKKYSIDSTPTIIINEQKLDGSATFNNIKKKIEKII
jgi:Protein-disulfide isomerase